MQIQTGSGKIADYHLARVTRDVGSPDHTAFNGHFSNMSEGDQLKVKKNLADRGLMDKTKARKNATYMSGHDIQDHMRQKINAAATTHAMNPLNRHVPFEESDFHKKASSDPADLKQAKSDDWWHNALAESAKQSVSPTSGMTPQQARDYHSRKAGEEMTNTPEKRATIEARNNKPIMQQFAEIARYHESQQRASREQK